MIEEDAVERTIEAIIDVVHELLVSISILDLRIRFAFFVTLRSDGSPSKDIGGKGIGCSDEKSSRLSNESHAGAFRKERSKGRTKHRSSALKSDPSVNQRRRKSTTHVKYTKDEAVLSSLVKHNPSPMNGIRKGIDISATTANVEAHTNEVQP